MPWPPGLDTMSEIVIGKMSDITFIMAFWSGMLITLHNSVYDHHLYYWLFHSMVFISDKWCQDLDMLTIYGMQHKRKPECHHGIIRMGVVGFLPLMVSILLKLWTKIPVKTECTYGWYTKSLYTGRCPIIPARVEPGVLSVTLIARSSFLPAPIKKKSPPNNCSVFL